mgnify:CR=1 FL=1
METEVGASEGIRTLDINLGKVALYQAELRSHPSNTTNPKRQAGDCKSGFRFGKPRHPPHRPGFGLPRQRLCQIFPVRVPGNHTPGALGFSLMNRDAIFTPDGPGRPQPQQWCLRTVWILARKTLAAVTLAGAMLPPVCKTLAAPAQTAADWPGFRGSPALLGLAAGTLPDKPALLWSFKTGGPVKSSAAVTADKVFVGSDDGHLYALDLANGRKLWAFKTGGPIESSPLVLDGRVFFGSSDAHVYALAAADGKLLWKVETGDKILGAPNWVRSPRGDANWVLVGSYDFKLYCLDAATGRTNWVYETGNYINGSPAVAQGRTVFGGCDAILHVISLADGQKLKEIEAGAYVAGSVALDGARAYFGHYGNEFQCVDLEKGEKVWTFKDRNFPFFSSPAVTADRVIFGGRDKRLHCVNKADGRPVWSFTTRGKVDSSPVVVGDKVLVGSEDGRVYLVSLTEGRELWSYEIGEAVTASPAVAGGRFVIGSEDGSVYCFGAK